MLRRPDLIDPIVWVARNDMQMQVEHGLLSYCARGSDQVHSIWMKRLLNGTADPDHRLRERCAELRSSRPKIWHVNPRDDQRVAFGCRFRWEEGDPVVSLADHFSF